MVRGSSVIARARHTFCWLPPDRRRTCWRRAGADGCRASGSCPARARRARGAVEQAQRGHGNRSAGSGPAPRARSARCSARCSRRRRSPTPRRSSDTNASPAEDRLRAGRRAGTRRPSPRRAPSRGRGPSTRSRSPILPCPRGRRSRGSRRAANGERHAVHLLPGHVDLAGRAPRAPAVRAVRCTTRRAARLGARAAPPSAPRSARRSCRPGRDVATTSPSRSTVMLVRDLEHLVEAMRDEEDAPGRRARKLRITAQQSRRLGLGEHGGGLVEDEDAARLRLSTSRAISTNCMCPTGSPATGSHSSMPQPHAVERRARVRAHSRAVERSSLRPEHAREQSPGAWVRGSA